MRADSYVFFFFSSRRRHTRCSRDWSSDVCSSDLPVGVWNDRGQRQEFDRVEVSQITRTLTVPIDVRPGSSRNSVNPHANGVIPVAVLSTESFDAASVDSGTVRFGATGSE